jgi:hypothetical protein
MLVIITFSLYPCSYPKVFNYIMKLITTAWCILRLQTEEMAPPDMEGSCECNEYNEMSRTTNKRWSSNLTTGPKVNCPLTWNLLCQKPFRKALELSIQVFIAHDSVQWQALVLAAFNIWVLLLKVLLDMKKEKFKNLQYTRPDVLGRTNPFCILISNMNLH